MATFERGRHMQLMRILVVACAILAHACNVVGDAEATIDDVQIASPPFTTLQTIEDCWKPQFSTHNTDQHEHHHPPCWPVETEPIPEGTPEPQEPLPTPEAKEALQRNYALEKDGAKVIAANKDAKKLNALLDDDMDSYMRNDCNDDKWVIIELSQVVKINRLKLEQYELYSARVREFEVFGRLSTPNVDPNDQFKDLNDTQWKYLGTFTASRAQGTQSFIIDHPAWTRYVLLHFTEHHGNEHVCALNGVSVLGKSAAEELEDQLASDNEEEVVDAGPSTVTPLSTPESAGNTGSSNVDNSNNNESTNSDTAGGGGVDSSSTGNGENSQEAVNVGSLEQQQQQGDTANQQQTSSNNENSGEATTMNDVPETGGSTDNTNNQNEDKPSEEPAAAGTTSDNNNVGKEQQSGDGGDGPSSQNDGASKETSENGAVNGDDGNKPSAENQGNAPGSSNADSTNSAKEEESNSPPSDSNGGSSSQQPVAANNEQNAPSNTNKEGGEKEQPPPPAPPAPVEAADDLLVSRGKTASSVYEVLVQEIRTTKAQQKLISKTVDQLQRNITSVLAAVSSLQTAPAEELARQIGAILDEKLSKLGSDVAVLQATAKGAALREHASLLLIAMMAALQLLGSPRFSGYAIEGRRVVTVLAVANGLVAMVLHIMRS